MGPPGGAGIGMHVIPVEKAIETEQEAIGLEKISYWLHKYEGKYAKSMCSCRASRDKLGEGCGDDVENWCIAVGDMADYVVQTQRGEYITYDEAMAIFKQAEDNGFYLNRDELREYSTWGCYYADCRNHLSGRDALDTNTVIYGHSANDCDPDGVRFTKLHRYMDADFVKENPYIYLSVDGDDLIFQITALFITDTGFDYIDPNPMGSKLTEFFQTVEKKNWLDIDGVTFSEGDTFLTLSTCCRKYDKANSGNQRLVVMAKMLPEGATAQEFSVSLVDDPEMP